MNRFENIIVFGNKLYKKGSYFNFGMFNALQETFGNKKCNVQLLDTSRQKEVVNYKYNTLFFINEPLNNDLIHLDKTNFYIILDGDVNHFRRMSRNKLFLKEYNEDLITEKFKEIQPYHYINKRKRILMMPYATLLTKQQMLRSLRDFVEIKDRKDKLYFMGHYDKSLLPEINRLSKNIIIKKLIHLDDELDLVKENIVTCRLQRTKGKIDFRTFTHISCGTLCITNSEITHKFFDEKLCLIKPGDNVDEKIAEFKKNIKKSDIYALMENIINNHTYNDRIKFIFKYINDNYKIN